MANGRNAVGWRLLTLGCAAWLALQAPVFAADEAGGVVPVADLTPETEKAIDAGLAWLIKSQDAEGSWGTHKTATTALSLMAFMVKGHFPEKPPYGVGLTRAVDFLLAQAAQGDGYMGKSMYEHGLATLALSEVWGMSSRADVRDSLKNGVSVILRAQNPQGGWRYNPTPTDADLSVTVMQLVALASAKEAGILVPDETIEKAIGYVMSCQHKESGGFAYQPGGAPAFERSAAGVMSLIMCGQRNTPAVKLGLVYLLEQPGAIFSNSAQYFYGHYYGVQAMYQAGEQYYQEWYPKIRDELLKKQSPDGQWTDGNGIGTQMAILILGVPYRFLPIYQR